MTVRKDLRAARNVPWGQTLVYLYTGDALPLTGASIEMQVRLRPGAPGAALATCSAMDFEDDVATAGELAEAGLTGDDWRALRIDAVIAEATLAAFPTGLNVPESGQADAFAYDVVITYADAAADVPFAGRFLLEPGVTD
jgi:hypothetical protein